jgi:transcriptional regulator with XRE-family HTH domain
MRTHSDLENRVDGIIADRMKYYRVLREMTQVELGKKIGVSTGQIYKYESGMNRITGGKLYLIASALDISLSQLFDELYLSSVN